MHKKAAGIVLVDKSKILLQLRDNNPKITSPNKWGFLGGGAEKGETYLQAVVRETEEEASYKLKNPKLFLKIGFPIKNFGLVHHAFFVEEYDEKQKIVCKEGQKMEFFTLEEMQKLDLTNKILPLLARNAMEFLKSGKLPDLDY